VLLVTGILTASGQFQSSAFYDVSAGVLSGGISSGSFTLKTLGQSGEILSQLNEEPQFVVYREPMPGVSVDSSKYGAVTVNAIPVTLSIPYTASISQVQLIYQGKSL